MPFTFLILFFSFLILQTFTFRLILSYPFILYLLFLSSRTHLFSSSLFLWQFSLFIKLYFPENLHQSKDDFIVITICHLYHLHRYLYLKYYHPHLFYFPLVLFLFHHLYLDLSSSLFDLPSTSFTESLHHHL